MMSEEVGSGWRFEASILRFASIPGDLENRQTLCESPGVSGKVGRCMVLRTVVKVV